MRHFLLFVVLVFAGLLLAVFSKNKNQSEQDLKPVVKVYGPSSFISQWGPGTALKEQFEKTCVCHIEWNENGEIPVLLQKLRLGGAQIGADLILGLDQYDLDKSSEQFEWKKTAIENLNWVPEIAGSVNKNNFVAYDWGVLTMIVRKSENHHIPQNLEDFLASEFKSGISLPDPRTSTTGLQFLLWLIQLKGEEQAFQFLKKMEPQILSYSPGWSTSYGIFSRGQAKATFSYITSPLYHLVEEKNSDVVAVNFKDPLPLQMEYLGIPVTCHSCDLAEKFAQFMLSAEGQKIIMDKNYMFPVLAGVRDNTAFASIPAFQTFSSSVLVGATERERILKRWVDLRKAN